MPFFLCVLFCFGFGGLTRWKVYRGPGVWYFGEVGDEDCETVDVKAVQTAREAG